MLTSAFNEQAEHQRETDFNYSMKGDIGDVGRIVTNASQEHRSERFLQEKRKKEGRHLSELLHMQQLEKELDGMLERMEQILVDLKKLEISMTKGKGALNSDNLEDKTLYLQEYQGYTAEELEGKSQEELNELIENEIGEDLKTYEQLKDEYITLSKKYETKVKENPDLKEEYEQEVAEIKVNVEKINRSFMRLQEDAGRELTGKNHLVDDLRIKNESQDKYQISSNVIEDDPFAEKVDKISDPFNDAASGLSLDEDKILENGKSLENNNEKIVTPLTVKP